MIKDTRNAKRPWGPDEDKQLREKGIIHAPTAQQAQAHLLETIRRVGKGEGIDVRGGEFPELRPLGDEYGEVAPFQYFIDHSDAELIEAVRRGRAEEFAAFHWAGKPLILKRASTPTSTSLNAAGGALTSTRATSGGGWREPRATG